jgi:hypothetical protein
MTDETNAGGQEKKKAGPVQVAKAVFWSFLGIRRSADHDRDAVTITPLQIIVAGIIGAALFVLTVIMVVRLVVS